EYLGFAAVRRGVARESFWWRLDELRINPGDDPRAELCDLISNASHDDFRRCRECRPALEAALEGYDFPLTYHELREGVRLLLAEESLGEAMLELAAVGDEHTRGLLDEARTRLERLAPAARDLHLRLLAGWLEQVVEARRDVETGYRLAQWLQRELAE